GACRMGDRQAPEGTVRGDSPAVYGPSVPAKCVYGRTATGRHLRGAGWVPDATFGCRCAAGGRGHLRPQVACDMARRGRPRGRVHRASSPAPPTLSAWLAPSYPVSEEQAARLARGETPVQLSDGQLTKKEAHLWLLGGGGEPLDWLCQRLPAGCPPVRSFAVARWLLDV